MTDDYGDWGGSANLGDYSSSSYGQPDLQKDPDATVDVVFRWAADLNGDTILTSTFLLPDGLTQVASSHTASTATILLSGGEEGRSYRVTSRITTAAGRTLDKSLRVLVREQ